MMDERKREIPPVAEKIKGVNVPCSTAS